MFYKFKLTDAESNVIEINDEDNKHRITDVQFNMKQNTELASERATDIFASIEVSGIIEDEESQTQTCALLKWAQETRNLKKVYKHLMIEIWRGDDDLARKYELDDVYCVDYSEKFGDDNKGSFKLKLAQKKGQLGSIQFSSK